MSEALLMIRNFPSPHFSLPSTLYPLKSVNDRWLKWGKKCSCKSQQGISIFVIELIEIRVTDQIDLQHVK